MSLSNPNSLVTEERLSDFYQAIRPYLNGPAKPTVYGFHIEDSETVPSEKVTYLADAVGMIPAHMDYENDVFDYGSWEDAFFMPRPCMLKFDGTVDYYLDPNDYSKKEDGTPSDVADLNYQGNAMMEWGQNGKKIWCKVVPDPEDNKSADIYIADEQIDEGYHDWCFHNELSESSDHFYTSIYHGYLDSNNRLRSISNTIPTGNKSPAASKTYAEANNPTGKNMWTLELAVDIELVNYLLMLIGKSTDTQTVFGKGLCKNGSAGRLTVGSQDSKGLFYGTNSADATTNVNAVKVFGMENWWGLLIRRYLGDVTNSSGARFRKLTYGTEDGSTTTGYNLTGSGYVEVDISSFYSTFSNSPIKSFIFTEYGMFIYRAGGTTSTDYCDSGWASKSSGTMVPGRGGYYNQGEYQTGAFTFAFNATASYTSGGYGATISCKP